MRFFVMANTAPCGCVQRIIPEHDAPSDDQSLIEAQEILVPLVTTECILLRGWGCYMEGLINLEFLSDQVDAVLKAWAIVIPFVVLLLWVAWKIRGIFRA